MYKNVRSPLAAIAAAFLVAAMALLLAQKDVEAQSQETWKYTALGSSITGGSGDIAKRGFVWRYDRHAEEDNPGLTVNFKKMHKPGSTSSDQVSYIQTQSVRDQLASSQVISLETGGKDWLNAREAYKSQTCGGADNQDCLRSALSLFESNWDYLTSEIASLRDPDTAIIHSMIYHNPYVAKDVGADSDPDDGGLDDFQVLSSYLTAMHLYAQDVSESKGMNFTDMNLALNGPNRDRDVVEQGYARSWDIRHLSKAGYERMALALVEEGYDPLR